MSNFFAKNDVIPGGRKHYIDFRLVVIPDIRITEDEQKSTEKKRQKSFQEVGLSDYIFLTKEMR